MKSSGLGYLIINFMLGLFSTAVLASPSPGDNWNTEGLNGGFAISATLTESPCSLAPESAEQEISMGTLSWEQIRRKGSSAAVPVHLVLEDCIADEPVHDVMHGDILEWIPSQPVVMVKITGESEPGDLHQFHLYGSASGAALHLEDANHEALIPGEYSRAQVLTPGRNNVVLQARLIRTSAPLVAGEYQALITLGLEYH